MQEDKVQNSTVVICDKEHLNISFNIYKCGVSEIRPSGSISFTNSDSYYMVFINKGLAILETKSSKLSISKNQGFFVSMNTSYTLRNNSDDIIEAVWVAFTGYRVDNYIQRANITKAAPIFKDTTGEIRENINFLYEISKVFPNRYSKMMASLFNIFSNLLDQNINELNKVPESLLNPYVRKAIDYIKENYKKDITVDEISNILGISRNHFCLIFSKEVNMSPKQYLVYLRMEIACRWLRNTQEPISQIAEDVGYANQFYFSRAFKKCIGVTPSEYRKNPKDIEIVGYHTFLPALADNKDEEHGLYNASSKNYMPK